MTDKQSEIDMADLETPINELQTAVDLYHDIFMSEPDITKNTDKLLLVFDVIERISNNLHKDYYTALDLYFAERKAAKVTELKQVA